MISKLRYVLACPTCDESYTVGPQVYHRTLRSFMGTNGSFWPVNVLRNNSWPDAMGVEVSISGGCHGWRLLVSPPLLLQDVGWQKLPVPERDIIYYWLRWQNRWRWTQPGDWRRRMVAVIWTGGCYEPSAKQVMNSDELDIIVGHAWAMVHRGATDRLFVLWFLLQRWGWGQSRRWRWLISTSLANLASY